MISLVGAHGKSFFCGAFSGLDQFLEFGEFLHAEFAEALVEADIAVVTDVYGAREDPWPGVSGKLIVDSILRLAKNKPVVYLPRLGAVVDYLQRLAVPGDLVLTLGAGDVHRVGERFLTAV